MYGISPPPNLENKWEVGGLNQPNQPKHTTPKPKTVWFFKSQCENEKENRNGMGNNWKSKIEDLFIESERELE